MGSGSIEEILQNDETLAKDWRVRSFFNDVHRAADAFYEYVFEPKHRVKPFSGQQRSIVVIPHNADADGFASEIVLRSLEAITKIVERHRPRDKVSATDNIAFSYERAMRLSTTPGDTMSYQEIAKRHPPNAKTFYWLADMGGTDLSLAAIAFQRGLIVDHHQNNGKLGDGFLSVNPLLQELSGGECSGATATYFVFNRILQLLHENNPFRLEKDVRSHIKEIERAALLATLAGANADRVNDEGLNKLLYTEALESKLIKKVPTGLYGYASKRLFKILAEVVPYNFAYPVLFKKDFKAALARSLGKQDERIHTKHHKKRHAPEHEGLSPGENTLADYLYERFFPIFMVDYPRGEHMREEPKTLQLNRMNLQFLNDDEISELNTHFNVLGLPNVIERRPLLHGEESLEERLDVVDATPNSLLPLSRFINFTDDVTRTTDRYLLSKQTLVSNMRRLEKEVGQRLGRPLSTPNLVSGELFNDATLSLLMGDDDVPSDELSLFIELCTRSLTQYADPYNRNKFIQEILRPGYQLTWSKTGVVQSPADLFYEMTVPEIGNMLTALSKLGMRDRLVKTLDLEGRNAASVIDDIRAIRTIHSVYKSIISAGMRDIEDKYLSNEQVLAKERLKNRIYFVDFTKLRERVQHVIEQRLRYSPTLKAADFNVDLRTFVGIYAGIAANTRKLPDHYVVIFSATQEMKRHPDDETILKISGRVTDHADDIFPQLHLGRDVMAVFGGGGHPGAASCRIPESRLKDFFRRAEEVLYVTDEQYRALARRTAKEFDVGNAVRGGRR